VTQLEQEALEHIRRQYAGVFSRRAMEQHVQAYVGMGDADQLVELVERRRPDARVILDVGCGYGSFVLAARERGLDAVGVELSSFELGWARRRLAERRPGDAPTNVYVQADACALPYAEGSFDAVCLWNVVEHVADASKALQEAARVLRPGGSLFVLAPNYATVRKEAHYHVPWAPLLPRRLAVAYLRALGRDPEFYRRDVHPCTTTGIVRALRRAGLRIHDPRVDKLADPATVRRPAVRRAIVLLARLRLLGAARLLLRATLLNPVAPTIALEAVKRP
jgi:MPBQ/MSBQ methyltransferase